MKKTHKNLKPERISELFDVFAELNTHDDYKKFFADLCTINELHALADRWYIAKKLNNGASQMEISYEGKLSLATISRVSSCLKNGSGYRERLPQKQ